MLDFWKTIITTLIPHLLGWPVAAVILGLVFKNQVSTLLARLKKISATHGSTGLDIEAEVGAADQKIEKSDVSAAGSLSASVTAVTISASPTTLVAVDATEPVDEAARQAMIDFGKGIDVVQAREADIRGHLALMRFELNTPETTDILIRNLAYVQAVGAAERTYRLIFGSQLLLLRALNIGAPKMDSEMQPFYERAKKKNPKFYGSYSYEDWRNFLLNQRLIAHDEVRDVYGINGNGRSFLGWITSQGLSEEKAG
jgi:hypothetical protein